jgi:hypothetical protein
VHSGLRARVQRWLSTPSEGEHEGYRLREVPPWASWAAGMVMVAGILHLVSLPGHLSEARGAGLFFLLAGAAQVVWGCVFLLRPSPAKAKAGVILLTVAPTVIWVLTRSLRSPWALGPEPVDLVSLATVALQAAAAAIMLLARLGAPGPGAARRIGVTMFVVVLAGVVLGAGSYGGAMAVEASFPWLGEPDAHMHGEAPAGTPEEHPHPTGEHPHAPTGSREPGAPRVFSSA